MQLKNLFRGLLRSLKLRNGRGFLSRSSRDNSDYVGEAPLPEELLVTILLHLSPADITVCRRVCRVFNQTIQGCSALVYVIECHIFQVAAGPSVATMTSSGERLTLFNQWLSQKREENLEVLRRPIFSKAFERRLGPNWGVHDGVFWNREGGNISFRRLQGVPDESWTVPVHLDHYPHILFDAYEDLLLLGHHSEQGVALEFRAGSTGLPHPEATLTTMTQDNYSEDADEFNVKICGDFVLVCVGGKGPQQLYVLNWKTGEIDMNIHTFHDTRVVLRSVTFCGAKHLVGVVHSNTIPVSVFAVEWERITRDRHDILNVLGYAACLQLPRLANADYETVPYPLSPHRWRPSFTSFCTPGKTWEGMEEGAPSFYSVDPPLIVLDFIARALRDYAPCEIYNLAMPGRTLISRILPLPSTVHGQMLVIPWEEWGQETRIMDGRYMMLGLEHQPAFASQFVYVEEPTESQDAEFQVTNDWPVVIYDFDTPGSLARDTASKHISSLQSIVSGPPNLKKTAQELLHNPMIASAPYRRTVTGLSVDMRSEQWWDGNCLVSSVTFDENRWATETSNAKAYVKSGGVVGPVL